MTRAIVDASTTYFAAHEFTTIAFADASVVRSDDFAVFSALDGKSGVGAILHHRDGRWDVLMHAKGMFNEGMLASAGASIGTTEFLTIPCPPSTGVSSFVPAPLAVRKRGTHFDVTTASQRVVRVAVRTVTLSAIRVRFATVSPPITRSVAATVVTVCERPPSSSSK